MGIFATPFIQPQTVRLPLEDGHWIECKRELSYGDLQAVASATRGDLTSAALQIVAAYLVEWSLQDAAGQSVPIDTDAQKMAALKALSNAAFTAIDAAIGAHVEALQGAKKAGAPSGKRKSARI